MKKEIRREIKQLRAQRDRVCKDWSAEIKRLSKTKRQITTQINYANRHSARAVVKIDRRIGILRGRLS